MYAAFTSQQQRSTQAALERPAFSHFYEGKQLTQTKL